MSEDILWREKQKTIKKKGLVSEDIYWEKKRQYKQKIVVSEDTFLG